MCADERVIFVDSDSMTELIPWNSVLMCEFRLLCPGSPVSDEDVCSSRIYNTFIFSVCADDSGIFIDSDSRSEVVEHAGIVSD